MSLLVQFVLDLRARTCSDLSGTLLFELTWTSLLGPVGHIPTQNYVGTFLLEPVGHVRACPRQARFCSGRLSWSGLAMSSLVLLKPV